MPVQKGEKKQVKDLVQIDADTAMLLYSKGLTHLPVLKRDGYSSDWTAAQPLYLDDIIEDLMIFVSDADRNKVLNPPKVDISKIKEEIALEKRNLLSDDEDDYEDDDPDWTEEPTQVESIPDDDEVPERERIQYEKPEVITVEQVTEESDYTEASDHAKRGAENYISAVLTSIEAGGAPMKWNVRDAIDYHDRYGISYSKLATFYGIKSTQTVIDRINQYKMK